MFALPVCANTDGKYNSYIFQGLDYILVGKLGLESLGDDLVNGLDKEEVEDSSDNDDDDNDSDEEESDEDQSDNGDDTRHYQDN